MPFIPKSHQKSKHTEQKSPEEVRATIAQIRKMCDQVEQELGGVEPTPFDMREAKHVPISLGLCPDEMRRIIDTNMADTPINDPPSPPPTPPTPHTPPASTPSVYDGLFGQ